jgi:hypothetical protein
MKKIEGKFNFENTYVDNQARDQVASVILIINYQTKEYSIESYCGTKDFQFRQLSHKWEMWKAILKSINEAIDFANDEIK